MKKIPQRITIELTPEEAAEMQALAIRYGHTPKQILTQFVSDLTGSLRTRGSDERDRAESYVQRTFTDRIRYAEHLSPEERATEKEIERMENFQNLSYRHRREQQEPLSNRKG